MAGKHHTSRWRVKIITPVAVLAIGAAAENANRPTSPGRPANNDLNLL
ncbi:hypothetical protein ES703_62541 [subsurface metagenome]